jgi:hypothetical protein
VVSNGTNSTGADGQDYGSLFVKADSPVKTAKDLAGRTVAANTLKNIVETSVRQSVRKDGGDAAAVKFTELAFPDQVPALESGSVDAIFVVEPFQQTAVAAGARRIASSYVDVAPDLTVAVYFTSQQLISSNPDLVARFTTAMKKSLAYADAHPDEVRNVLVDYIRLPHYKRLLEKVVTQQEEAGVKSITVMSMYPQEGRTFFISVLALGYALFLRKRVLIMDTVHQTRAESYFLSRVIEAEASIVSDNAAVIDEKLGLKYGDYARKAASTLQDTAVRLDEKDLAELGEDAKEFVRKSPGVAIAGAAVAGFLLARLFRGSND